MNKIFLRMQLDWVDPYKSMGQCCPVVVDSTHPRWGMGSRLDWGFIQTALEQGYEIVISPRKKEGT